MHDITSKCCIADESCSHAVCIADFSVQNKSGGIQIINS